MMASRSSSVRTSLTMRQNGQFSISYKRNSVAGRTLSVLERIPDHPLIEEAMVDVNKLIIPGIVFSLSHKHRLSFLEHRGYTLNTVQGAAKAGKLFQLIAQSLFQVCILTMIDYPQNGGHRQRG